MVQKIRKHINLKEFLKETRKQGIGVDKKLKYHKKVKNLCNNGSAFLYLKFIEKFNIDTLKNLEVHTGKFNYNNKLNKHTWIEYSNRGISYIIDITLCQFDEKIDNIYIKEKDERFITEEKINFTNYVNIMKFFERI